MTTRSPTEVFQSGVDQNGTAIVTGHTSDADLVDLEATQFGGGLVNMNHSALPITETSEHQQVWLSQNDASAKGKSRYSSPSFCCTTKMMPTALSSNQASHYWKLAV